MIGALVATSMCNGVPVVPCHVPQLDCDVFLFDYRSPLTDEVLRTLSPEEQARSERFVLPLDARRFRARRAFVRAVLSHRLGCAARMIEFVAGDFGKPRIVGTNVGAVRTGPLPEFSVSGSGGFAVLAIAAAAVGIDIEDSAVGVWHPPSASLVLSQAELDWVASACDADSAFLRCWTRKEALAKLEGTGLHESLTGLTLTPQCLLPGVEIVDLPHPASGALALALRTGG